MTNYHGMTREQLIDRLVDLEARLKISDVQHAVSRFPHAIGKDKMAILGLLCDAYPDTADDERLMQFSRGKFGNLKTHISQLRKFLTPAGITVKRFNGGYILNTPEKLVEYVNTITRPMDQVRESASDPDFGPSLITSNSVRNQ